MPHNRDYHEDQQVFMGHSESGSRTVVNDRATRVEIVEPWKAGEYDPPMQDWLRLPVADSCPADSSHTRWGTVNPRGYFMVRSCNHCRTRFRAEAGPWMIHGIIEALMGMPRRFGMGYVAPAGQKNEVDDGR